MQSKFRYLLPLILIITGIFFSVHVITQQMLRQTANDPQIQLSEDIASTLAEGKDATALLPRKIELTNSIAPFVIIYDKSGNVVSSTVRLSGKIPELPQGVLEYTKATGQNRLTWQPATNVREAVVVTYFNNKSEGYVLAGRSLREVEIREDNILRLAGMGWLATVIGSFIVIFLFFKTPNKK